MIALLNLSVLGFSFVVLHDKAIGRSARRGCDHEKDNVDAVEDKVDIVEGDEE